MSKKLLNPNARVNPMEEGIEEAPIDLGIEVEADGEEISEDEGEELDVIGVLERDFEGMSRAKVERWKERFGRLSVFFPAAEEAYVFRSLNRLEYTNVVRDMNQIRETAAAQADPSIIENTFQERVLQRVVLYPPDLCSPEKLPHQPAGLFPTLFELVMKHSHFVGPEAAMSACYRL